MDNLFFALNNWRRFVNVQMSYGTAGEYLKDTYCNSMCFSLWGKLFIKWASPGVLLFIFIIFKQDFTEKNCALQRDSNSDTHSWRQACWLQGHNPTSFGYSCSFKQQLLTNVDFSGIRSQMSELKVITLTIWLPWRKIVRISLK